MNLSKGAKTWGRSLSRFLSSNSSVKYGPTKELIHNDLKIAYNNKFTTVSFLKDDKSYSFSNAFLRDSSDGFLSVEPLSGQKLFTTASISEQAPEAVEIVDNERFYITWPDGEKSLYSKQFLQKHSTDKGRKEGRYFDKEVIHWDSTQPNTRFPELKNYDYNEYLNDDRVLAQVLEDLNKFGIANIANLPSQSDEEHNRDPIVKKIGQRIGYIKETFYGTVFDVHNKPNAGNIADTDKFLPLHQDLLYYESPPGLQLLHFIKNKSTGGENVFADGFAAANYVKETDHEAYSGLLNCPTNFHYDRNGHHYFQARCLVVEGENTGQSHQHVFKEVNYSPPFQAPFDFGITTHQSSETNSSDTGAKELGDRHIFEDFLRGLRMFENHINDSKNNLKFKTDEGTCILFDNRRVLHARDSFDANSGERWLKGCYLDRDAFQSKLRVVKNK